MNAFVISASKEKYFPNTSCLFNNDSLLIIVLKIVTVIQVVYALIQDLFYNLKKTIKYFNREQKPMKPLYPHKEPVHEPKPMDPFYPCEENSEKIQDFLLTHASELFTGELRLRNRSHNSNILHYGTKRGGVFSLKNLPSLIFKKDTVFNGRQRSNFRRSLGMSVDSRFENILQAHDICKQYKFNYLKVPKSIKFEVTPTNPQRAKLRKFQVLAQEMFCPVKDENENLKIRDANLSDNAIEELVVFILKTGFYDVDDRNLLVIQEKGLTKIAIIDYEYVNLDCLDKAFHGGSINESQRATIQGLFNILPRKVNLINDTLIKHKREDLLYKI